MRFLSNKYNSRTKTLNLIPQYFLVLFLLFPLLVISQKNDDVFPFQRGEYLKYRVFYDSWMTSWMTSGYGIMMIAPEWSEINGHQAYHITVEGYSVGLFDLFYKVRDRFESYMDQEALMSHQFIRYTREGGYKRDDTVMFDHQELKARSLRAVKDITPNIQDMVSAFYYVRTLDFEHAKENDKYYLDFFLDDSLYHTEIIFLGRQTIKTDFGKIKCLKFKPRVASGEIFQEQYPMELWVTDDKNKIPVMIKSAVIIGSVKIELVEYSGLRWPLGKK